MNATATRRKSAEPAFEVVTWTQHWRRIDGHWYRDAVARVDDELRLVSIPDEVAA